MSCLDIRNKEKEITFKILWLQEQVQKIRKVYSVEEFSNEDLAKYLLEKYNSRRIVNGRFYNNTNNSNEVWTQEQFINYFLNSETILSGYSCFYENQDNSVNIGSNALKCLLDNRKFYKKKMEASEYGSDDYVYYKVLQLTYKVLANSYYGIGQNLVPIYKQIFIEITLLIAGNPLELFDTRV